MRDGCSWQALRDEIPSIPDLSDTERAELGIAYDDLERLMGNAFFTQGHPIADWVWEGGAGSRQRFVDLAARLQRQEQTADFARLCADLTHPKKAAKTLDVLEWWDNLVREECVVTYEPPLPHKHGAADLLIVLPQECYVELSELETGAARHRHNDLRSTVLNIIFSSNQSLLFAGKTIAGIDRSQRDDLAVRLLACRRDAKTSALATMEDPGVILLVLALLHRQQELGAWAGERGLELGHLTTPPLPELEDWRVRRKIEEKSVQLPPKTPGILILYSHEIYLQYVHMPAVLSFLEEELRPYPNISALALRGLYFPHEQRALRLTHEGHRITAYNKGRHWESTLLLYNPVATLPIASNLRERLEGMLLGSIDPI